MGTRKIEIMKVKSRPDEIREFRVLRFVRNTRFSSILSQNSIQVVSVKDDGDGDGGDDCDGVDGSVSAFISTKFEFVFALVFVSLLGLVFPLMASMLMLSIGTLELMPLPGLLE